MYECSTNFGLHLLVCLSKFVYPNPLRQIIDTEQQANILISVIQFMAAVGVSFCSGML